MSDDQPIEVRDSRKRPFFWADNVIIDHYAAIIGPYATLIYLALSRHADQSTRESHPSHEFLAKKLHISRATVKRSIATLIEHRLIECKHRKSKSGDPDTNIYILLEPWGRFPQTLPYGALNAELIPTDEEVGSDRTEVGSVGTEGRVSQNRGVGSVGATNKNHLEQDSMNKKKDLSPTPLKKSRESKPAILCPPDFQPSEKTREGILEKYPGIDIEGLLEDMKLWSESKGEERVSWNAELVIFAKHHVQNPRKRTAHRQTGGFVQ